jgi:hypothetical protein
MKFFSFSGQKPIFIYLCIFIEMSEVFHGFPLEYIAYYVDVSRRDSTLAYIKELLIIEQRR